MIDNGELLFGRLAVERRLISQEQLDKCVAIKEDSDNRGEDKSLKDIMVEQGMLIVAQAEALERLIGDRKLRNIGGYELLSKLGQGGMGAVYKACQKSVDRIVALKVLPPRLARDNEFLERFFREARAAAKLDHPNIVKGIDAGEAEGFHYFAMEFVDGRSVRELLRESGRLEPERALDIVMQITRALEHAALHGFIHRDIKPDNILLSHDGKAKLADLGLAKSVRQENSVTQTGIVLGTPNYISPEQAAGLKNIDIRSDIYSLGATFYHMLTGETPYKGASSPVIMAKHMTEPPPDIRDLRPEFTERTAQLIFKFMAKEPNERFQTPTEVLAELNILAQVGMTRSEGKEKGFSSDSTTGIIREQKLQQRDNIPSEPLYVSEKKSDHGVEKWYDNKVFKIVASVIVAISVIAVVLLVLSSKRPDPVLPEKEVPKEERPKEFRGVAKSEYDKAEKAELLTPYLYDRHITNYRRVLKSSRAENNDKIAEKAQNKIKEYNRKKSILNYIMDILGGNCSLNENGLLTLEYDFKARRGGRDWTYSSEPRRSDVGGMVVSPVDIPQGRSGLELFNHLRFYGTAYYSISVRGAFENAGDEDNIVVGAIFPEDSKQREGALLNKKAISISSENMKDDKANSAKIFFTDKPQFGLRFIREGALIKAESDISGAKSIVNGQTRIMSSLWPAIFITPVKGNIYVDKISITGAVDIDFAEKIVEYAVGKIRDEFEKRGYLPKAKLKFYKDNTFKDKYISSDKLINKLSINRKDIESENFKLAAIIYAPEDGEYEFICSGEDVYASLKINDRICAEGSLSRNKRLTRKIMLKRGAFSLELSCNTSGERKIKCDIDWIKPSGQPLGPVPSYYIFH